MLLFFPSPQKHARGLCIRYRTRLEIRTRTMRNIIRGFIVGALIVAGMSIAGHPAFAQTPAPNMSFFVTSSNPKGGNLGGLTGADAVCQSLARAVGAGGKTWPAYLSTSTVDAKS